MRPSGSVFALLAVLSARAASADEHIVLPPVSQDKSLPEKMLLFVPGGKVPNEHYSATAASIQSASASDVRLWVVIPAVFQRLCIITCSATSICQPFHATVEEALSKATAKGWRRGADDQDIWLAGHSLGGVCANTLFQALSTKSTTPYAGLIVMGSYVDETGSYDLTHYPKPVFTLNVELDGGLARPGKTSTWWRQHLAISESQGEEKALVQKPVLVLPGLNHSDFCPGFDVPGDLPAEVAQEAATVQIGEAVANFLRLHIGSSTARDGALKFMREQVAFTKELLAPYLKAQDMERTASDTITSPEGASPFCAQAQHIVAGLSAVDDKRIKVEDGFHVSSPSLEHCHPNWTATGGGNFLLRSCSHTDYYADVANTGSITAASEIACKMLSSDRVVQQLKTTAANSQVDCSAGNKWAVQVAESMAAPSTLSRFKRIGRGWCFEADRETVSDIGPLWVFSDALKLTEKPTCMSVSSPRLKTAIDGKIFPGSHYCKFLSPARVLDWMMTDGIKKPKALALEGSGAAGMLVV